MMAVRSHGKLGVQTVHSLASSKQLGSGGRRTRIAQDTGSREIGGSRKWDNKNPNASFLSKGGVGKEDAEMSFHSTPAQPKDPPSSLAFVESRWFQGIVGTAIFLNALVIGFETEIDFDGWAVVQRCFLFFFTTELSLRLCLQGWSFYESPGNVMDFFIVAAGVLDSVFLPFLHWLSGGGREEKQGFTYFISEALKLLRIVRLVRLVKIIDPLLRLALGVAEAVQGMFWVLVFLFMMLYASAILCTRLLGHGEAPGLSTNGEETEARDVREMFDSVWTSMFILFEMMSCWSLMTFIPLFNAVPLARLLAVLFYILMAWALLAVMTGVVSEKIIAVKDALNSEELDREQEKRLIAGKKLRDLFMNVDIDGSGSIAREEFNSMLYCNELSKVMTECTQTNTEELMEVFNWLDHDGNGVVDIDEFVAGFTHLNEQVTPKSFLKFQEGASKSIRRLEKALVAMVHRRFDKLVNGVSAPLRKLSVVQDQVKYLEAALLAAEEECANLTDEIVAPSEITDVDLDALEDRLLAKMAPMLALVESLGPSPPGAIPFLDPPPASTPPPLTPPKATSAEPLPTTPPLPPPPDDAAAAIEPARSLPKEEEDLYSSL